MFQGCSIFVGGLSNLCSCIIANVWVEGGDKHERLVEQPVDLLPVGLNAYHTVVSEGNTGVSQEADGAEDVGDHHRLEHIELKVAVGTTNGDSHMVAHHLSSHHGAARLIFWQRKLSKAAPGTRAQKPDVVGDLHDAAGKHIAGARHLDHSIMGSQGLELVGGSDKWKTSEVSHLGGNFLGKANPSVQTCAYCSSPRLA